MPRTITQVATVSTILMLTAISIGAAPARGMIATPGGARGGEQIAAWERTLADAEADVRQEKQKRALRTVETLLDEMVEKLATGPVAAGLLGRAAAVRALARAGLGETGDALWDWDVAVALSPAVAELDLGSYGAAGGRLAAARDARPAPGPAAAAGPVPQKKKGKSIDYPESRLVACDETPAEVRVAVGGDGVPHRPEILPGQDLVLSFVALETLRGWRFEPVAGPFTLRTDLTKKRCRDLLATRRGPAGHSFEDDDE